MSDYKGLFDPHLLVSLAHALALADCFPEALAKTVFSIDFLGKLDAHLESKFFLYILYNHFTINLLCNTMLPLQPFLMRSTWAFVCGLWSTIVPCALTVQSFRCLGFMSVTVSTFKRKVTEVYLFI